MSSYFGFPLLVYSLLPRKRWGSKKDEPHSREERRQTGSETGPKPSTPFVTTSCISSFRPKRNESRTSPCPGRPFKWCKEILSSLLQTPFVSRTFLLFLRSHLFYSSPMGVFHRNSHYHHFLCLGQDFSEPGHSWKCSGPYCVPRPSYDHGFLIFHWSLPLRIEPVVLTKGVELEIKVLLYFWVS